MQPDETFQPESDQPDGQQPVEPDSTAAGQPQQDAVQPDSHQAEVEAARRAVEAAQQASDSSASGYQVPSEYPEPTQDPASSQTGGATPGQSDSVESFQIPSQPQQKTPSGGTVNQPPASTQPPPAEPLNSEPDPQLPPRVTPQAQIENFKRRPRPAGSEQVSRQPPPPQPVHPNQPEHTPRGNPQGSSINPGAVVADSESTNQTETSNQNPTNAPDVQPPQQDPPTAPTPPEPPQYTATPDQESTVAPAPAQDTDDTPQAEFTPESSVPNPGQQTDIQQTPQSQEPDMPQPQPTAEEPTPPAEPVQPPNTTPAEPPVTNMQPSAEVETPSTQEAPAPQPPIDTTPNSSYATPPADTDQPSEPSNNSGESPFQPAFGAGTIGIGYSSEEKPAADQPEQTETSVSDQPPDNIQDASSQPSQAPAGAGSSQQVVQPPADPGTFQVPPAGDQSQTSANEPTSEPKAEGETVQPESASAETSSPKQGGKASSVFSKITSINYKPFFSAALMGVLVFGVFNSQVILGQVQYLTTPSGGVESPALGGEEGSPVAGEDRIIIPRINVDAPVVYDIDTFEEEAVQEGLEDGVVHYGNTAMPGQIGNSVIVGHSSNNWWDSGEFKYAFILLDRLEEGDEIILHYEGSRYVYEMRESLVVEPTDISVIEQGDESILTLITCTPPGTSWQRLVVQAEQVSPDPEENINRETAPEDDMPSDLPRDNTGGFGNFIRNLF